MNIREFVKGILYRMRGVVTTKELVKRGMQIGDNFNRMHDVLIDDTHCWLIQIGDSVTLAPKVQILAHDASTKCWLGYTKIGEVSIGNRVFVGGGTVILPGVVIGDDVVIGAGSVVSKSLEGNGVYAGNPCRKICSLEEYIERNREKLKDGNIFSEKYIYGNIQDDMKEEMKNKLKGTIGYLV